jgi:hypothetical protein
MYLKKEMFFMSIIDYTKNLTMFDDYELKVIEMIIDELKLK